MTTAIELTLRSRSRSFEKRTQRTTGTSKENKGCTRDSQGYRDRNETPLQDHCRSSCACHDEQSSHQKAPVRDCANRVALLSNGMTTAKLRQGPKPISDMKKLVLVLVTSKESMIKCAIKKKYAPLARDWSRKTQETSRRARLRNAETNLRNPLANESGVRFTVPGPRDDASNCPPFRAKTHGQTYGSCNLARANVASTSSLHKKS